MVGAFYRGNNFPFDAIAIYRSMYMHFLKYQVRTGRRVNKGMPLVWIAECYAKVKAQSLAKRYLMLTLVEDAITLGGIVDPKKTGSYFRLAQQYGLSDMEIKKYAKEAFVLSTNSPREALFPEFILQDFDKDWMVEIPSASDSGMYVANALYVEHLSRKLKERSGRALENLADYLMSCIPGCRTSKRVSSYSTDYDIVCSLEGPDVDFRADFGRYFICECKDWKEPVGFSEFAKFVRVLDSIKARFGIIFSREGISGERTAIGAGREQAKVFQDRGLVIVVVDSHDLDLIAKGGNLVSMLRQKYEQVRLDLPAAPPTVR